MRHLLIYSALGFSLLFLGSCGSNETEIRSIVLQEIERTSTKEYFTDALTIGPYSPAVRAGNFLFVSGQLGLDPTTGRLAGDDIESQTKQALENLFDILRKARYDSTEVIQCTIYLKDINNFQKMNLIYGGYFSEGKYPARATLEVSNLPKNAIVEIAAVAFKEFHHEQ